ncbi:DNA ligase [Sphaerosporella brunnea]|uniref:DNA ligase n=1 Tax=Sphaerosporella brunnea TaxID=1250544 RepID=A0A5J5EK32_9PEZI|nr:DNA ligase [Sphaerosporella brunnea]
MPPKAKKTPGAGARQSTLGSFFTLPKGQKPPELQQTKLKRTRAAPKTALSSENEDEPEGVKVDNQDEVMDGTEEADGNTAKTKKRVRDEEVAVKAEEEEEPATKRGRKASATKKKVGDEGAEPVKKRGRPAKTTASATKGKGKKVEPESEEEAESKPKSPTKAKKVAATAAKKAAAAKKEPTPEPEPEASASEAEVEAESENEVEAASETEQPAISQGARKQVQSKLTAGGKGLHPYPDWAAGTPVPYAALVKTFTLIEATSKRLEKLSHTSLFLRQVLRLSPDELLMVIHMMINRLAADYEGVELGIGESLLMKAICESCGRTMQKLKEDHKEVGDLGEVAMKSRNTQTTLFKPKPLTVASVHAGLKEIATTKGEGGQTRKVGGIKKLLSAAKGDEAKYLVRCLEGKLRLGLAERTVIVALSQAMIVHEAEKAGKKAPSLEQMTAAESILKEVYSSLPNYEIIIPEMMKVGIMKLKDTCKMQPGVPLKPMLAKPTKAISEVLDRFEGKQFTCEYKYDGERVQIHYVAPNASTEFPTIDKEKGIAKIFSRNSEELSPKYPDILAALDKWVQKGVESFVLDCEAVAWDREEKRVLPFQQLMTRKKKDVAVEDVKVKVCVFGFDLLFLNGKSLVQETLADRRKLMYKSFTPVLGEFAFATATDGQELETIQSFLEESIKASCEGLMVKMLDTSESFYEPSKRSRNWLKVKKDYLAGAGDSLDLVVIGAYHGKGKRTSWYGAFLLACYNPSSQNYETICNIGTGFSEEMLAKIHAHLVDFEIEKPKPYYIHASGNMQQPDVWFEPKVVWEVKTADLSLSPKYMAAKGIADTEGKGRGISLRFPRFIRERDDKKPDDATTSSQVAEMYNRQDVVMNGVNGKKGGAGGVDDDFEY